MSATLQTEPALQHDIARTKKQIRLLLWFFIIGLVLSGVTAFPIETELVWLNAQLSQSTFSDSALARWIAQVTAAVVATNARYPFLAYGTDWLAFAHLVIAVAFIGPLRDPVRNIWVLQFGMIACAMVLPLAFIAGPIRQIPVYWQLIDSMFGIIGIVPLYICYRLIKKLEGMTAYRCTSFQLPSERGA